MAHHFKVNTDPLVQNEARAMPEMKSSPIFGQKQCSNQLFLIISRLKIFIHINFASVLNAPDHGFEFKNTQRCYLTKKGLKVMQLFLCAMDPDVSIHAHTQSIY